MLLTSDISRELSNRLKLAVERGLKQKQVSARQASMDVVGHDGLIRDIRSGKLPSVDRVYALMAYFDIDFFGPTSGRLSTSAFSEAAKDYITLDGSREGICAGYHPLPYHPADLAHRDLSHLAVARAWVDQADLDIDNLSTIAMPDEDMLPSIELGQLLLVDSRFQPQPEPELCAMRVGSHLRVGWLVLPKAGHLVAFFERSYTPPVVQKARSGPQIECLGRIVARLDDNPAPLIDNSEKRRLFEMAKQLVSPAS